MSRSPLSSYSIINTWNKLIRFQHHHRFLSRCKQLNSIPQGLKLNFKLALGSSDEALKQRREKHLFAASMNILSDLVNFADTTTRQLQQQVEEKRKLLFEHHDQGTALDSWNTAKRSTISSNRSLNLRYRHKIKKVYTVAPVIYHHTEQLHEENARIPKHKNRRFSKKVRIDKKRIFFSSARRVSSTRRVPSSLGERRAFSRLKNLDEQAIRIQDKGSKFVILDKTEYSSKMLGQLENPLHYKKLDSDPSANYANTILEWSNKWLQKRQIDQNIANWVVNNKAKPGKAFGTIKTHKEGNPLRLITSCRGTAIENLSAFTEFYLKPLAQKLPSFVKDTTHLLQKIEDLNKTGPFPEGTLLVSWDVVSMFPNIDNNLGIKTVTNALNSREFQIPSTECIVEAVKICLEHNNSHFQINNFCKLMAPQWALRKRVVTLIWQWELSIKRPNLGRPNLIYGGDIETTFSIFGPRVPPS
ncbi:uncharacterized protein [Montipora foliosa]|uniref:uncharacterized protein n=1 Tax=Montipora foliosa TaxID=591990 RepID=UPI0035F16DAF